MKQINQFITEYIIKKRLDKPIDSENHCIYFPKTKEELISNIKELFDKGETDLNCIDTSEITDMSYLFKNVRGINFDVSNWNVSNVENMSNIFSYCGNITDIDLSKWNVSNGMYFNLMFYKCENFKGNGLEKWSLDNAEYMSNMFEYCENFDCDVSNWKMSKAETIKYMFSYCVNFTGKGLNKWKLTPETKINKALDHCNINKLPSWYKT